jgi:hypothetical protein
MDKIIHEKNHNPGVNTTQHQYDDTINPYAELERFWGDGLISKSLCPEPIPWWGVSYLTVYRSGNTYNNN